jgi:hypothetical protein
VKIEPHGAVDPELGLLLPAFREIGLDLDVRRLYGAVFDTDPLQ